MFCPLKLSVYVGSYGDSSKRGLFPQAKSVHCCSEAWQEESKPRLSQNVSSYYARTGKQNSPLGSPQVAISNRSTVAALHLLLDTVFSPTPRLRIMLCHHVASFQNRTEVMVVTSHKEERCHQGALGNLYAHANFGAFGFHPSLNTDQRSRRCSSPIENTTKITENSF